MDWLAEPAAALTVAMLVAVATAILGVLATLYGAWKGKQSDAKRTALDAAEGYAKRFIGVVKNHPASAAALAALQSALVAEFAKVYSTSLKRAGAETAVAGAERLLGRKLGELASDGIAGPLAEVKDAAVRAAVAEAIARATGATLAGVPVSGVGGLGR